MSFCIIEHNILVAELLMFREGPLVRSEPNPDSMTPLCSVIQKRSRKNNLNLS